MRYLIACLPSLIVIGLAVALAAFAPGACTANTGTPATTEIRELRHQTKLVSDRLMCLEAKTHHVVPRGGLSYPTRAEYKPPPAS